MEIKKRDGAIDILRFIALAGIILVHINPPSFWCQIRGFDVPLMVFLSGIVYGRGTSNNDSKQPYLQYCGKRFKRLVIPTWFFLLFYYVILYSGLVLRGHSLEIDSSEIIHNFTLMTGWYVWIIRVFLLIALLSPFIYKYSASVNIGVLLLTYVSILVIFELFYIPRQDSVPYYLTMTIPYMLFFSLGSVINRFNGRVLSVIGIVGFVVFVTYAISYYISEGQFITTDVKKYPPLLYYTSYALFVVVLLWLTHDYIYKAFVYININKAFEWIGSHTLWVYFWHIIAVTFFTNHFDSWILRFIIAFGFGTIVAWIQSRIVIAITTRCNSSAFNRNINIFFNT